MFPCQKLFRHPARLLCVALVGDIVALENRARAMTGDLHDHRFGNAGSAEIANGGSAQIVKQETGYARSRTRQRPAFTKILDGLRPAREQEFAVARLHLDEFRHVAVNWDRD